MIGLKKEQFAPCNRDFRYWPLDYFIETQKSLGVKTIELWAGPPHVIINDEWHSPVGKYRNAFEKAGISVPVCCSEIAFNRQYFFCSYDELAREKAMGHYHQVIDFSSELGANILVVNCAGGVLDEDPKRAYHRARFALKRLGDYAAKKGVRLAVENLTPEGGNITHTLAEIKELIQDVDHPNVKVCLDISAMAKQGETIGQWFDALGDNILHIHFVDSKQSGRMVWGEGLYPLDNFLEELNKRGYIGYLGQNYDGYCEFPAKAAEKNYIALSKYFI